MTVTDPSVGSSSLWHTAVSLERLMTPWQYRWAAHSKWKVVDLLNPEEGLELLKYFSMINENCLPVREGQTHGWFCLSDIYLSPLMQHHWNQQSGQHLYNPVHMHHTDTSESCMSPALPWDHFPHILKLNQLWHSRMNSSPLERQVPLSVWIQYLSSE